MRIPRPSDPVKVTFFACVVAGAILGFFAVFWKPGKIATALVGIGALVWTTLVGMLPYLKPEGPTPTPLEAAAEAAAAAVAQRQAAARQRPLFSVGSIGLAYGFGVWGPIQALLEG